MSQINILDCTLRDGGYCNNWRFGKKNIEKIIKSLIRVNIEIIECGILTDKYRHEEDTTLFNNIQEIKGYLLKEKDSGIFVCLANYGEYDFEQLPQYDGSSVDGIRITFHKQDLEKALNICEFVQSKGYKVFVQAMVSLNYSDEEYLMMLHKVNRLHPFAFYIVDSFGAMMEKDLKRLFFMADHNLDMDICIGFHSHNNLQLAYANAQTLTMMQTFRRLIVDCSVMGMGRGAGNLNTELFVNYLNDAFGKIYNTEPLLVIIDQILDKFYCDNYWGYSLSNYLSATHNLHPNYAKYLTDKQTLTVEDINKIFLMVEENKKAIFDSRYIEKLYLAYMGKNREKTDNLKRLKEELSEKEVLIIAPGSSSRTEKDKIVNFLKENHAIVISINFDYPYCKTNYIFLSNLRRYETLSEVQKKKCIVTSNIPADNVFIKTQYTDLLNENEFVRDNAGMMLVKYLMKLGVKKIILAGMDGYTKETEDNYFDEEMSFSVKVTNAVGKNKGMSEILGGFSKNVSLQFLTKPKYVGIGLTITGE